MIKELHRRQISSFLVTNGQFPAELEQLRPVTQLYVSLDAPNEDDLKEISRPLFKDHWQRLRRSLEILSQKRPYQRSVARLTVLKGKNMQKEDCEGYAELVHLGDCDFVEVKGATFAGWDDRTGLTMKSVPWHEEVRDFAQQLAESLPDYAIACEHEHSCSVLLARTDRFFTPFGHWRLALGWSVTLFLLPTLRTWIDFDAFSAAAAAELPLRVEDFTVATPQWALAEGWETTAAQSPGFDPREHRRSPRVSMAEHQRRAGNKARRGASSHCCLRGRHFSLAVPD
eukprot:Skav231969  [mRNA]  locus=scaffold2806:317640:319817:+ [translate_table: standard]